MSDQQIILFYGTIEYPNGQLAKVKVTSAGEEKFRFYEIETGYEVYISKDYNEWVGKGESENIKHLELWRQFVPQLEEYLKTK